MLAAGLDKVCNVFLTQFCPLRTTAFVVASRFISFRSADIDGHMYNPAYLYVFLAVVQHKQTLHMHAPPVMKCISAHKVWCIVTCVPTHHIFNVQFNGTRTYSFTLTLSHACRCNTTHSYIMSPHTAISANI